MGQAEPLDAVRGLRAALQAVAHRWPHLVDPSQQDTAERWTETLEGTLGEDTKQAGFRLPSSLLDRIDRHAEQFAARTGVRLSKTDTVRRLLELALDVADLVEADPVLAADPPVIRDLVAFALEGVQEARRRAAPQIGPDETGRTP